LNRIFIDASLFIDYIREKTRDFAFVWDIITLISLCVT